jgi:predicted DNA-binding transcriptional regulator AlpA
MSSELNSPAPAPAIFTVPEFCLAHRISRTALYKLWGEGNGPRRIQIGTGRSSKVLISAEAAADWRREREAATEQKVA